MTKSCKYFHYHFVACYCYFLAAVVVVDDLLLLVPVTTRPAKSWTCPLPMLCPLSSKSNAPCWPTWQLLSWLQHLLHSPHPHCPCQPVVSFVCPRSGGGCLRLRLQMQTCLLQVALADFLLAAASGQFFCTYFVYLAQLLPSCLVCRMPPQLTSRSK